ncbi:Protein kinase domain [Dillenia turbinata]|uniref:Protein kinase domain n=1 Tax=Dillenia turbinata TaxID=194707 RepID=A0AAN8V0H7_9MAGN
MVWNCFCCVSEEKQEMTNSIKKVDYPWEIYTLKEILHATNNFHNDNKIGEGGFGSVYWGRTMKRLKAMSAKAEMEFAVEVEILGRVRHKNLLGLRGFYAGGDERLIVYDYMPNHSLITHLHGQLAADLLLDWPRRMSIAIGSAEGLVLGVPSKSGRLRLRKANTRWSEPSNNKSKGNTRGSFDHIADPKLKGNFDLAQLRFAVMIALRCTDSNPENRPTMIDVVKWLKGGIRRAKEIRAYVDDHNHKLEESDYYDNDDDDEDDDTDYENYRMDHSVVRSKWTASKMR